MSDQDTAQLFLERIAHSVCMRSRLVEGQLEAALPRGLKQLVILGAGLDATAYRRTDLTKDLHVFEVDYPSTQVWKRERLKATGAAVPDNVTFVPFDFENETLMAALMTGGVDPNAMTLFPWLGVQPYLTDAAVRGTMEVVCQFPEGSEVVLDFASPDYEITGDLNEEGLQQLSSVVESMGEPFLSRYMPNELDTLLRECGFSDVSLHRSKALAKRFLGGHEEAFAMPEHVIALASAVV